MTMQQLIKQIEQWAEDRNLIHGSTPQKQMLKLMEEFGELCAGIARNNLEMIKDAIGDCFVVLSILKNQLKTEYDFIFLLDDFSPDNNVTPELACLDLSRHIGDFSKSIYVAQRYYSMVLDMSDINNNMVKTYSALLMVAYSLNMDISDCVQHAYDQIKDRKGEMRDGVWVKEGDL